MKEEIQILSVESSIQRQHLSPFKKWLCNLLNIETAQYTAYKFHISPLQIAIKGDIIYVEELGEQMLVTSSTTIETLSYTHYKLRETRNATIYVISHAYTEST